MASSVYCTNVAEELQVWSDKLNRLSTVIDHVSTGEKYKVFQQIEGLHIIRTELDDRLNELLDSCPIAETVNEKKRFGEVKFAMPNPEVQGVAFDYDFGG